MSEHNGDQQSDDRAAERLTALALNQLSGEERAAADAELASGGDAAQREVREIQTLAAALTSARTSGPLPQPAAELRKAIEGRLEQVELPPRRTGVKVAIALVSTSLAAVVCALLVSAYNSRQDRMQAGRHLRQIGIALHNYHDTRATGSEPSKNGHSLAQNVDATPIVVELQDFGTQTAPKNDLMGEVGQFAGTGLNGRANRTVEGTTVQLPRFAFEGGRTQGQPQDSSKFQSVGGVPTDLYAADPKATASVQMAVTPRIIIQEEEGERHVALGLRSAPTYRVKVQLSNGQTVSVAGGDEKLLGELTKRGDPQQLAQVEAYLMKIGRLEAPGTEQYDRIIENAFLAPRQQPLSTFSIDVDTASYANVRRFLTGGSLPPANAVRIEELVNYFKYDDPQPKAGEPFSVNMEVAECPWQTGHLIMRVGLKGKDVAKTERPQSNLVFLLDVSGSMSDENKLPLLKTALHLLVGELGENDRVSIVTYAGEAGLRLAPTGGHERGKINAAIDSLSAGGSTNGSAGINLAYEQAAAYFVKGGTNRVILCTDGDLNVGVTSDDALTELIKQKAAGGTFLTVLGFGEGNLKDAKLEKLADNGNGLYAYIDSVREARKVLVEQLTGSTITIAKDVKIQIEFNPQEIAAYRLLGYENRVLAAEDFANDNKDAGEIGAGHTVTALYELIPVGAAVEPAAAGEQLKYQESGVRGQEPGVRNQEPATRLTDAAKSGELLTLKLRYKEPEASESKLIEYPLKARGGSFHAASRDLQFAASVASFGMILRGSEHKGSGNLAAVLEIASGALGEDAGGYRAEFVDLVRKAQALGAK